MRYTLLASAAMLVSACTVPAGEESYALLIDESIPCVPDPASGASIAVLTLERADDIYLAELVQRSTGKSFSAESVREGLTVRFTCPNGLTDLTVRRATVTALNPVTSSEIREPP